MKVGMSTCILGNGWEMHSGVAEWGNSWVEILVLQCPVF
jgi:hypothetical protein